MLRWLLVVLIAMCLTLPASAIPIVDGRVYAALDTMPTITLRKDGDALGTTPIETHTALIPAQRTNKYMVDIAVLNFDATGYVCLFVATYAQTCSDLTTRTCLGADDSLNGILIPPKSARVVRFTGAAGRVCAVANEANVDVQFERSILFTN